MTPLRTRIRRSGPLGLAPAAHRRRSGIITLELLLVFPILLIAFLAVVQFGLMYSTSQYVSYASRFGAKLAAEEPAAFLDDLNEAPGSRLRLAIDQYLDTVGLDTGACRIILQHNVGGVANPLQEDVPNAGDCECDVPMQNLPTITMREYVRVTVCVPLEGNIPDLLCTFGFSIEDCVFEESTTFIFERFGCEIDDDDDD